MIAEIYQDIADVMIGKPHELLSEQDIDEIIGNFDPQRFEPPVVLEHDEDGTAKTFPFNLGKIMKLYKEGRALWARVGMHTALAQLIKDGLVKGRSIQFFRNYENTGKAGMRHLSFLGKSPPQIKGMPAVALSENYNDNNKESVTIEFQEEEKRCKLEPINLREGEKMPDVKESVFTLSQHEALLDAAVEKAKSDAAVMLSEKEAGLSGEIEKLSETVSAKDAEITTLRESIVALSEEKKKIQIVSFLNENQLKFLPAHRESIEAELMELSDKTRAVKMKNMAELPDIIELGERSGASTAAPISSAGGVTAVERAMFGLTEDDMRKYGGMAERALNAGRQK